MSEMALAHFNVFWFSGLLLPAAVMIYAATRRNRSVTTVLALASVAGTYLLSVLACKRKWDLRVAYVWEKYDLSNQYLAEPMPEEAQRAFVDGANLIFTGFVLAPAEALLATLFWYAVGRAWHTSRPNRAVQAVEPLRFNDQY